MFFQLYLTVSIFLTALLLSCRLAERKSVTGEEAVAHLEVHDLGGAVVGALLVVLHLVYL